MIQDFAEYKAVFRTVINYTETIKKMYEERLSGDPLLAEIAMKKTRDRIAELKKEMEDFEKSHPLKEEPDAPGLTGYIDRN